MTGKADAQARAIQLRGLRRPLARTLPRASLRRGHPEGALHAHTCDESTKTMKISDPIDEPTPRIRRTCDTMANRLSLFIKHLWIRWMRRFAGLWAMRSRAAVRANYTTRKMTAMNATDGCSGGKTSKNRARALGATACGATALAVIVLAACASESIGPPPAPPVNWESFRARAGVDAGADALTARERDVAVRYATALAAPDLAPLAAELEDDAHFTFPGRDDVHGRTAVVHAHDLLIGAFENRHVTTTRIFRTPSEQTVEWTMTGTQSREWMGVAPTNKPVTIRALSLLFTKDDGSVTDVHVYFDVAAVRAQLGVGPKELLAAFAQMPQAPQVGSDAGTAPGVEALDQAGSQDEKTNFTMLRGALDALETDNLAAYEGAFADDVRIVTSERAQPAGKADVASYFKTMRRAIGQLDTTVTDGWGVGSYAVAEYTIAGEQRGAIGWIPAAEKAIRFHIVDVAAIANGKIVRVWRYENPLEAAPAPPT
jgi:predicted ester cyclase